MQESPLDPLDRAIAAKRAAIVRTEHDLEIERAELRAMEFSASLRPVKLNGTQQRLTREPNQDGGTERGGRGKLPGTISRQWIDVMAAAVNTGNVSRHHEKWAAMAHSLGYNISPITVRDWLRRGMGMKLGYIERARNDFRVTDLGIEKLGLKTATPPPETIDLDKPVFE